MTRWAHIALLGITVGMAPSLPLQAAGQRDALPKIGPAPDFVLTTQEGKRLSLGNPRGKVVAITFIHTSCTTADNRSTEIRQLLHSQAVR